MTNYEVIELDLSRPDELEWLLQHTPQELQGVATSPTQKPLALVANQKKIAFSLFRKSLKTSLIECHWCWIDPDYHNEKVGQSLLQAIVKRAEETRAPGVILIFGEDEPFEKYLEEAGWSDPEYFKLHCILQSPPPWIRTPFKLPPEYELFLWKELTAEERHLVTVWKEQKRFPSILSPLFHEDKIEFSNSLGMRHNGALIGWMVTRRISPDTIQYSSFFTLPEYRAFGPSMKMLSESIRLHADELDVPKAHLEVNFNYSDHRWLSFVERRLIPYSVDHYYFYKTFKKIN